MSQKIRPMIKLKRGVKFFTLLFFTSSIFSVLVMRFVPITFTPLMLIRSVEQAFDGDFPKAKRDWTSYKNISKNMVLAVVSSEDNKFPEHYGFDFVAIERALKHNSKKKKIRGGSTISQQTGKNVFLVPARNWVRKGFETYFTVLIEATWSKKRIMEAYLNIVELGNGIYGVQAASEYYFEKDAKKLTKRQSALLAATLPSPLKRNPGNPNAAMSHKQEMILRIMRKIHSVDL